MPLRAIWNFLVNVIATLRLLEIIKYEKISQPFRDRVGILHDDNGGIIAHDPNSFVSKVISCSSCLSVWCGLFIVLMDKLGITCIRDVLAVSWVTYRLDEWTS